MYGATTGFTIGRFTLGGTYNLMMLGAAVGVIGAALYQWVAPWLIGPRWFRRLTVGLSCGAVVGSMLIHADGVDFTVLKPTWLAVSTFVAIPTLFGIGISVAVDRARATPPTADDRPQWMAVVLVLVFPPVLLVIVPAAVILAVWGALRRTRLATLAAGALPVRLAVRAAWMAIALLGLRAMLHDIAALRTL